MAMNFADSETRLNLMRAFAGESQARNRYTFAASQAKKEKLEVVQAVFLFTAEQEKEHAEVFYGHLRECSGDNIRVDGGYPVDLYDSTLRLLRAAQHNEYEEHDPVYRAFGETALREGFPRVAASFLSIADIEQTHGDRFGQLADLLEQGKLFVSDTDCGFMCLNCGFIYRGKAAPEKCPVCAHGQGYFIRLDLAPYTAVR